MQQYRRQIGVVFQDYKLLEWLTAKENVLYPLHIAQLDAETIQLKYDYIVNLFKLYKYIDDPVKFLSG
jgi:cell division transport system ATP-binding protein